ncbi:MAG: hypothetical protein P1U81_06835 [Verrucomicrobiales bacterium]|nr:hypothetical protein [Verrucomicrobiales bacterium]
MGRNAAYTGQVVTWDEAMKSEDTLAFNLQSWEEEPPFYPDKNRLYEPFRPGLG